MSESSSRAWRSQPARGSCGEAPDAPAPDALSAADMDALISYSQPAAADDLLLGDELSASGVAPPLVRRMTRLWLRGDAPAAVRALAAALRARGYVWRRLHPTMLAIECGAELRMRASALRCGGAGGAARTLLEFRRSRGCGLQFKRRYLELRRALQHLEVPPPDHHRDHDQDHDMTDD